MFFVFCFNQLWMVTPCLVNVGEGSRFIQRLLILLGLLTRDECHSHIITAPKWALTYL